MQHLMPSALLSGHAPAAAPHAAAQVRAIRNALTIDVEDYFQVSAFAQHIRRSDWEGRECRIERNMERVLALLDERGISATFFTLGWIAERYPALVRRIVASGHELASHGYDHERVSDLSPQAFFQDISRAKALLQDLTGVVVQGYRAPSFSIGAGNLWALDALEQAGYRYSSSIYPVAHDHYGSPEAPRFAHQIRAGLLEVPPTTVRLLQRNFPASGGGYFRFFPYALSRWMLRRMHSQDQAPAVFYFHPWELDAQQPRVAGIGVKTRFRHYVNVGRMEARLRCLLQDFHWGRMDHIFLSIPLSTLGPGSGTAQEASHV